MVDIYVLQPAIQAFIWKTPEMDANKIMSKLRLGKQRWIQHDVIIGKKLCSWWQSWL